MPDNSSFDPHTIEIRSSLADAIKHAWHHLSGPGTWWTAEERLKMVAEARNAANCELCATSKKALSPYSTQGTHDTATNLSAAVVEVIHRIMTDAGRLTESWLKGIQQDGLSDAEYVEIASVVAITAGLDTFNHAFGLPLQPLPTPRPGEPSRVLPANASQDLAWVATFSAAELEKELRHRDPNILAKIMPIENIHRGFSLVPDEVLAFFEIDTELYLTSEELFDFTKEYRAISHAQLELIATRAAALNGCHY